VSYTSDEVREKYDRFAPWYDWVEGVPEMLGLARLRRRLLARAEGAVLEVAAGTGRNFPFYPPGCRLTAVDLSPAMLAIARRRAARLGLDARLFLMDAAALDFPDRHFDTVLSTCSLCTFPDPVAALREMSRVCRTSGRILLLEHGRSGRPWLGRWQDRHAESHARMIGCYWNREPCDLVRAAGLSVASARRSLLGVLHAIEARPARGA
jgi:ubiquinone/menaquinone biosynthesis C-methylase UbiE